MLVSPNLQHGERLEGLLRGYGLKPVIDRNLAHGDLLDAKLASTLAITTGALHRGFRLPLDHLAVVTESEIFGDKATRRPAKPKKAAAALAGDAAESFKELELGAFVVHQLHGVGTYRGLVKLPVRGTSADFLHLSAAAVTREFQGLNANSRGPEPAEIEARKKLEIEALRV